MATLKPQWQQGSNCSSAVLLNMLWGTGVDAEGLSCHLPHSGCHASHLLLLTAAL